MIAHCLFEQSGTFKNEFGETDYVIDLFEEIRGGAMMESRVSLTR